VAEYFPTITLTAVDGFKAQSALNRNYFMRAKVNMNKVNLK